MVAHEYVIPFYRSSIIPPHTHSHATLTSVQGGSSSQQYHATATQNTGIGTLTSGSDASSLHSHKKYFCISPFDNAAEVVTGDGTIPFLVPAEMTGYELVAAIAGIGTPGAVGATTDIQIRRVRSGTAADMLTTKITLSATEYFAADGVIGAANKTVQTGDMIYVDVDAVNTTPPRGLFVTLTFVKS